MVRQWISIDIHGSQVSGGGGVALPAAITLQGPLIGGSGLCGSLARYLSDALWTTSFCYSTVIECLMWDEAQHQIRIPTTMPEWMQKLRKKLAIQDAWQHIAVRDDDSLLVQNTQPHQPQPAGLFFQQHQIFIEVKSSQIASPDKQSDDSSGKFCRTYSPTASGYLFGCDDCIQELFTFFDSFCIQTSFVIWKNLALHFLFELFKE